MRAVIENWLLSHWYGTHRPPWYLRMLEPLYRVAYQRVQEKAKKKGGVYNSRLPLIVVGNIVAGGSGKTPLVIRLCELALDMGFKPGIASTGYGRQSRETLIVAVGGDVSRCGDEALLLAQRTAVPVVVAVSRRDAIAKLNELDVDLILSDDGLQQASLKGDIEICVVDGERGLGNGHLLPAGPLRESSRRLWRVDHVITNGPWTDKPAGLETHTMRLHAGEVKSLSDDLLYTVDEFRNKYTGTKIRAIAGIGHPERFFRMLEDLEIEVISEGYPDHHAFKASDFETLTAASIVLMTEKDAVKCRSLGLDNAWYLPVESHLPDRYEKLFKEQLIALRKSIDDQYH
jgi:tetraacyldisaccharide 4'-kinase